MIRSAVTLFNMLGLPLSIEKMCEFDSEIIQIYCTPSIWGVGCNLVKWLLKTVQQTPGQVGFYDISMF